MSDATLRATHEQLVALFATTPGAAPVSAREMALASVAWNIAQKAHMRDIATIAKAVGASAPSADTVRVLRLIGDLARKVGE